MRGAFQLYHDVENENVGFALALLSTKGVYTFLRHFARSAVDSISECDPSRVRSRKGQNNLLLRLLKASSTAVALTMPN